MKLEFGAGALMTCTWTLRFMIMIPACSVWLMWWLWLLKQTGFLTAVMLIRAHACLYIYGIVWRFAWGLSWHSQMMWQPCHKLICPPNFNYSSNSYSPHGYKLMYTSQTYSHNKHIYVRRTLVKWNAIHREWAYYPRENPASEKD